MHEPRIWKKSSVSLASTISSRLLGKYGRIRKRRSGFSTIFIASRRAFLLESVEGGVKWARYSFIGTDPFLIVRGKNGQHARSRRKTAIAS